MCKYISVVRTSRKMQRLEPELVLTKEDSFQQRARGCELARWLASIAVDVSV